MSERLANAQRAVSRGAEAALLLEHPLFQEVVAEQIEGVTQALLALPLAAADERLALCTVLGVLRKFKGQLEQIKATGEFDARTVAQLTKDKQDA